MTTFSQNNILLLKDEIGKQKAPTRNLPCDGFIFGKPAFEKNSGAAKDR